MLRERLHEMPDDTPLPPLPPLGDHRPVRGDDAPADGVEVSFPLELSPRPQPKEAPSPQADLELPPANPDAAPALTRRHPVRRAASVLLAGTAHVLILLALVSAPPLEFGSGGNMLDAISVSIVPASAIDARQTVADATAQAAPTQIAPNAGEDSTISQPTPEVAAPPKETVADAPDEPTEPDIKLAAPEQPAPETVPDEALQITSAPKPPDEARVAAVEPTPTPVPPEPKKEDHPHQDTPTPPAPASSAPGGDISHGTAPDQAAQSAAAGASPGEVNAYGAAVQSALLAVDQREAKARASASKATGTVVVRLSLDGNGTLLSAEVVKSSGRTQLDDAALLLIRLAAFPPPPPSLTPGQRSYIAPIRFQ